MLTVNYIRILLKNILLAVTAFFFINIILQEQPVSFTFYQDIVSQAFIYGGLIGLAASINEIMTDRSIRKKAARRKLYIQKVPLSTAPLYYIRLMRVLIIGSMPCLALIGLTVWLNGYPLTICSQLAVIPVSLALGANVPQTYIMYIRMNKNPQEVRSMVQQTLEGSIFEIAFKDRHHLLYKIADQWQYLYSYFLAPDRCTIEMVIRREHIEIVGTYRYLDSMMDDKYLQMVTQPEADNHPKEKVA